MGTKNNPGAYDCYANAEPDEPMFVLLARDETAEFFVKAWVAIRCGDVFTAKTMMENASFLREWVGGEPKEITDQKMVEAEQCAEAMRAWLQSKKGLSDRKQG